MALALSLSLSLVSWTTILFNLWFSFFLFEILVCKDRCKWPLPWITMFDVSKLSGGGENTRDRQYGGVLWGGGQNHSLMLKLYWVGTSCAGNVNEWGFTTFFAVVRFYYRDLLCSSLFLFPRVQVYTCNAEIYIYIYIYVVFEPHHLRRQKRTRCACDTRYTRLHLSRVPVPPSAEVSQSYCSSVSSVCPRDATAFDSKMLKHAGRERPRQRPRSCATEIKGKIRSETEEKRTQTQT